MQLAMEKPADKIEKSIRYMEEHLDKPITREKLASIAELHPEHYSRMFRKCKGMSPSEWLTNARMEKAKTLLAQANASILDVARKVGFPDPYHFSRRFKQTVGVAPSHYTDRPSSRTIAIDCLGHCLALGVVPYAANAACADFAGSEGTGGTPHMIHEADGQHAMMNRLLALQPDQVISPRKDWNRTLKSIANVCEFQMFDEPIYEQFPRIAAFLNKEREAAVWIEQYEARRDQLRQQVKAAIGRERVAVIRIREGLLQMYGIQTIGYPLYRSLQVTPPERIAMTGWCNGTFHSSVITLEELPYYAAEHLFVVLGTEADKQLWLQIADTGIWRSFPAVLSGNVYPIEAKQWLPFDPLSIARQMEQAARLLTARNDRHHKYPSQMQ
ncbi:helix-turn-helix domain-containing protein [Paenibacillus cymbidii]|uniref:helix-turn-helix domain-containing protein n=1 Tax=Paenibacillus cymbidii TaxID=1639034 RepID=UPI001081BF15|nr:helix-turn-helix domain-containing protein [Paenibacillus cymbidii]